MNASTRGETTIRDSLRYGPCPPHRSPPLTPDPTAFADTRPRALVQSPPMAPGVGGPNIDLPLPPLRPFGGDIAVKDLRRRLALDPNALAEPLMLEKPAPARRWTPMVSLVLIVTAVAGFAVTMLLLPRQAAQPEQAQPEQSFTVAPAALAIPAAVIPARLVIESQRAFANEPLPLGISVTGARGEETVTLVGLVGGTRITSGSALSPGGWQLSARELGSAFAYAPKDFVGAMDAAIDLRSARDRVVDSQVVRLEWLPKEEAPRIAASPPRMMDPSDLAVLLKSAEDALKSGDIVTARIILRRAAAAGNGQAALALGATYDPVFLAGHGVLGLAPDAAQARNWYQRAAELGATDAARRLERIAAEGR